MTFNKTTEISDFLDTILEPELKNILDAIHTSSGYFKLPDESHVLESPLEVSKIVALSANKYAVATRFAGIARARYKIAEANYKYKFRTSLGDGKNASEREAKAMESAQEEYEQMILLEAIVELAESIESSCRIASESARRMLLGSQQTQYADSRFDRHVESLTANDYTPF
jgi:hypothetical protein